MADNKKNLSIYNSVRKVPKEALREIAAGRLKGKSDINPMWRIKSLTEQFGPCGFGWKYKILNERLENGGQSGEIAAFVQIELFVKVDDIWSEAIPGTGGSSFVANERAGLYVSDECFKMALTDAISVSCKALGIGADIYWDKDRTKNDEKDGEAKPPYIWKITKEQGEKLAMLAKEVNVDLKSKGIEWTKKGGSNEWDESDYNKVLLELTLLHGGKKE